MAEALFQSAVPVLCRLSSRKDPNQTQRRTGLLIGVNGVVLIPLASDFALENRCTKTDSAWEVFQLVLLPDSFHPQLACNRDHVEVIFDSPKVRIAEVVFMDHKETSGSFEDSTRTSLRLWRALGRCRVHTAGPARFS